MIRIFDTQLKNVAFRYATMINARVTKSTLFRDLEENPFYPSLLSLSKVFSKYGITNNSYKITGQDLDLLKAPFIAMLKIDGQEDDFILVTEIGDKRISYIYDRKKTKTVPRQDFVKGFNGIVWVAEQDSRDGEDNYENKLRQEKFHRYRKRALLAGALVFFSVVVYTAAPARGMTIFLVVLLCKVVGCAIGYLLLLFETNKENEIIKNICNAGPNKKTSCESVLSSKASRVFGIGLGELCFFYFSTTILLLLLPAVYIEKKITLLAAANACTIPFVCFSLYYQWRVAKQWCKLCIGTVSVLLVELLCFTVSFWPIANLPLLTTADLGLATACILLPVLSWYALKPVFVIASRYDVYYPAFKRLENDQDIFNLRLGRQAAISAGWQHLGFTIGSVDAKTTIVTVSDPFCGPCGRAHLFLHELLQKKDDVQLRIIFINDNLESDKSSTVVKHLLAIADDGDNVAEALHEWYEYRNLARIKTKYQLPATEVEKQGIRMAEMHSWCVAAGIRHTPTIFVNGRALPEGYSPEDLKNII